MLTAQGKGKIVHKHQQSMYSNVSWLETVYDST